MGEMRQAYLIVAHKDDFVFRTLLRMLDDVRNDIFIHMDIKNKSYHQEETGRRIIKWNIGNS